MAGKSDETWVVIADGMHARILRWLGGEAFVPALGQELYDAAAHGFSRDLKSDHPGRAIDPGSGAHHAIEPRHDPHDYEKEKFGRHVAEIINQAAGRKAFDRLILVAPPKALGVLRGALDSHAAKRVVAELHKDLVRTPNGQLASHMREALGQSGAKEPAKS